MIFVECKPDRVLVSTLIGEEKADIYLSCNGKGEVFNKLERTNNCIGIVDSDPTVKFKHRYMELIKIQQEVSKLQIYFEKSRNNYVFMIYPCLEEWIIEAANELDIHMSDFSLPDKPSGKGGLHSIINANLEKFEQLVKAMKGQGRLKIFEEKLKEVISKLGGSNPPNCMMRSHTKNKAKT